MKSYLTTPIYYVNAVPHVGHAHTTVMGDIMKRARRMAGQEVLLATGTDEHGQKNEQSARQSGLETAAYLDRQSETFKHLFDLLGVSYDIFIRTSAQSHKDKVGLALTRMFEKGLLVKRSYGGLYCAGCEQFKKSSDLSDDGFCADHPGGALEFLEEENYFLEIAPYVEAIRAKLTEKAAWIEPAVYARSVSAMLDAGLDDLCVTRPKSRVSLGVELPFDRSYVIYVWFDALMSYITNIGWPDGDYRLWWENAEHLIGKDIVKTHAVHWSCILLALDLPLPGRISVHGHWLSGGHKMSKSTGNVVDPLEIIQTLGSSTLRFHLARHMTSGDSMLALPLVQQSHADLGNKVGNLLMRAVKFCDRSLGGRIPSVDLHPEEAALLETISESVSRSNLDLQNLSTIARGVESLVGVTDLLNDYMTRTAPWALIKTQDGQKRAQSVLYAVLDGLRLVLEGFYPVMPDAVITGLRALAPELSFRPNEAHLFRARRLAPGSAVGVAEVLFPRIEPADLTMPFDSLV